MKLGILLVTVFTLNAFAAESEAPDKWFTCQHDSDCVHIDYTCAGSVVNKIYLKEANSYYQTLNSQRDCHRNEATPEQKKIPYKVFCEKKKCKYQGLNPKKPGFS